MEKRDNGLRVARLTMLFAALLAAGGSFGLHPEPGGQGLGESPTLQCVHSPDSPNETHDCLACRAHRSFVFARASFLLSTPVASSPHHLASRSSLPRPGAPSRCVGRAPPAAA